MTNMIGKGAKRIDAYDKVTGKGLYASDFGNQFPNLLHVRALHSPYAHARITKLDISKAEKMPGVVKIVTGRDEDVDWDNFPKTSILAREEALWAGQRIALVAAETVLQAEDAVEAIEVEYERLPHVLDYYEASLPKPVSIIDPEFDTRPQPAVQERPGEKPKERKSPNIVGAYTLDAGDVDRALQDADFILEQEFWTGKKTASPLECANAVCRYDSDDGITMWSNGAGVHGVIKAAVTRIFKMPESKVRIIQPYMGGSFGSRLNPYAEILTVLMALKTKRTVQYEYTRKEMFTAAPPNWPCVTNVKLGFKKDGTIVANDYYLAEEVGAAVNNTFFTGRLSSSGACCVYNIPNTRMDTCAVATNTPPSAEYRGLGCPEAEFGIECLINEAADKLNMSPVEIRLKNMLKKGDRNPYGELITSIGLGKCLESVAEAVEIDKPSVQPDKGPWRRGKGVAVGGKQNTPLGRSEAEIRYHSDGTVELLISCDENGMGITTGLAQIVATELKMPMEKIKVIKGDTLVTPYDNYSASSRTTYNTGNAVKIAAEDLITKLKEEVARVYGIHPSKVTIENDTAYLVGSHVQEVKISTLFQLTSPFNQGNWGLQKGTPVVGRGVYCPAPIHMWDSKGKSDRVWNWFQYSACAVEVEVNEETGQVRVIKVASSADSGNPINPKLVESQIEGGVHMAIGFYLNEEHLYNERGEMSNCNFGDYRLPTVLDMPKNANVHSLIKPDPLPDGPYGAKGMAESIVIPVGPAIAEAIYKAVGVRVTGYPMTAERILKLIKEKEAAK
jgi:carbon-monoxide dehydrogenase large subunit